MHGSLQVAVSEAPPKRLLLDKMHATGAPDTALRLFGSVGRGGPLEWLRLSVTAIDYSRLLWWGNPIRDDMHVPVCLNNLTSRFVVINCVSV
jgi:hypothetical protein